MTTFPVTRLFSGLASPIGTAATQVEASQVLGEPAIFARQLHPEVFETIEAVEAVFGADLSTGKASRVPISGGWMALRSFWRPLPCPLPLEASDGVYSADFADPHADTPDDLSALVMRHGPLIDAGQARLVPYRNTFRIEFLREAEGQSTYSDLNLKPANLPLALAQGSLLADLIPAESHDGLVQLVDDEGDGIGFQASA